MQIRWNDRHLCLEFEDKLQYSLPVSSVKVTRLQDNNGYVLQFLRRIVEVVIDEAGVATVEVFTLMSTSSSYTCTLDFVTLVVLQVLGDLNK